MSKSKTQVLGSHDDFITTNTSSIIREKLQQKKVVGMQIHSLGGQGAKTAVEKGAELAINSDWRWSYKLCIGTERKGTPVTILMKVAKKENREYLGYTPPKKDLYLIFDETMIKSDFEHYEKTGESGFFWNAEKDATIIVNTQKSAQDLVDTYEYLDCFDVFAVETRGKFRNIPMLGAFLEILKTTSKEKLFEKINNDFGAAAKINIENIEYSISSISYQSSTNNREFKKIEKKRRLGSGSFPDYRQVIKISEEGEVYIDPKICNNCYRCIEEFYCPRDAIRLIYPDTKKEQPEGMLKTFGGEKLAIIKEFCDDCEMCIDRCKGGAIKIYKEKT